jgi:hypothetical protein
MNKDLHDMDELFRSELEGYKETPSAGVKESLIAALDKKDAGSYKKRFVAWKRTALLLLLLLSGILLYESGVLKTSGGSERKVAVDKRTDSLPGEKRETVYQKNKTNSDEPVSDSNEVLNNATISLSADDKIVLHQEEKDNLIPLIAGVDNDPDFNTKQATNKITEEKKKFFYKQPNSFSITANKKERLARYYLSENGLEKNYEDLPEGRINTLHRADKISFTKIIAQLTNNIQQLLLPSAIDSLSKSSVVKNKKINSFKPFWTISLFTSYERAGYRLDSDLPNNITNIKYREVHEPSFLTGFLLTRQFTKRWGLQSGLIYSHSSIGISPQKMYALQNGADVAYKYITSSGYAYIKPGFGAPPAVGDSLSTTEAKHTLQYVSVPAVIKYTVTKKKLSLVPGAGIEANFLTSAKVETEIQDASNLETVTITKLKGAKPFYWSITADAELRYNINKKVAVSLRPAFRYAISPITKNNVVETFPHSFGLGAGITIKF